MIGPLRGKMCTFGLKLGKNCCTWRFLCKGVITLMSPGCDEILNLLVWINETSRHRLKNDGPVKLSFKHFLFYSSKSKNDQKYEYFAFLWATIALACEWISSKQHACFGVSFCCIRDLNTYSVYYLIIFVTYFTIWSLFPLSFFVSSVPWIVC